MSPRKHLASYGTHGRSVRVFVEGALVRVLWREGKRRRMESWPDSADARRKAKAWALGVAERLERKAPEQQQRLTLYDLFDRYVIANDHWREKTRIGAVRRWRKFTNVVTDELHADLVTPELIDSFRAILRKRGGRRGAPMAANQVAEHVKMIKAVFKWARRRRLLSENPLADYEVRLSKEEKSQAIEMREYTPEECARIIHQLDRRRSLGWRSWVAVVLDAVLGPRQNALLNLQWDDVDLGARVVTWRSATDKLGKERRQALPRDAVHALRVAQVWRRRAGYAGPWVFFRPGKGAKDSAGHASARQAERDQRKADKHWTYQSLNRALHLAAAAAGVEVVKYRAMHGFRRMAARQALGITGNVTEALAWIGDTDIRMANRYLKSRAVAQAELAARTSVPAMEDES